MKRATTEDVRAAVLTAKKEVRTMQVLRIKAMTTVVLSALGEADERDRVDPCLSRIQESWTELSKQYKKAQELLKQVCSEQDDRAMAIDRSSVQLTQELRRNFKSIQTHLREQLKVALPQFFAETLNCDLQQPADVLKRVRDDENARKRLQTLESLETKMTEQGWAEITLKWTLGFSAVLVVTGTTHPVFRLYQSRPSANLAAFLRLLQAHVESRILMAPNLTMDICSWVNKNLLRLFAAACKVCGRVLCFGAGQPMLAMVSDHNDNYYHEECIRECLDTHSS